MSNIIENEKYRKRAQFRFRLQMIALVAGAIGLVCFGIVLSGHVQSAILGGIGVAALGVALVVYVWSRILGFVLLATRPSAPPRLR